MAIKSFKSDALFDAGLIGFDDAGKMLLSVKLSLADLNSLGLDVDMRLRAVDPRHLPYLKYHREHYGITTS